MLADITGRRIETVDNAQEVGAMGAAIVAAAGLTGENIKDLSRKLVKVNHIYIPDPGKKEIYERNYKVFKNLYRSNVRNFKQLNT